MQPEIYATLYLMTHINHLCAILKKDRVHTIGKRKLYYLNLPKKLSFWEHKVISHDPL